MGKLGQATRDIRSAIWQMDTSHISTRGNKKKGARYQCRGRIKVKNDEVVVMSEHSHAPIVARADMLKAQSDSK